VIGSRPGDERVAKACPIQVAATRPAIRTTGTDLSLVITNPRKTATADHNQILGRISNVKQFGFQKPLPPASLCPRITKRMPTQAANSISRAEGSGTETGGGGVWPSKQQIVGRKKVVGAELFPVVTGVLGKIDEFSRSLIRTGGTIVGGVAGVGGGGSTSSRSLP